MVEDHSQRLASLELPPDDLGQRVSELENIHSNLKSKVTELEGRSRLQNLCIMGLAESCQ